MAISGIVTDHGQVAGTMINQGMYQLNGAARLAKTAYHDSGAIKYACYGICH
jgi:hypothetical protein